MNHPNRERALSRMQARATAARAKASARRNRTIKRVIVLTLLFTAAVVACSRSDAQNHNNGGGNSGGNYGSGGHSGGGYGGGVHGGGGGYMGRGAIPAHSHLDDRFSHNHYYLDHGYSVHGVPHGAYPIHHGGQDYWYDRGHWYRRRGGVSIVIGAPLGAFVPFLPLYYSTVWWGGIPYYYSNDTYYTWDAGESEYEVVDPPSGIESGGTTQAPVSDEIFVYPKNGQSPEQQKTDRYECHRSAVEQTGYDPTTAGGGVAADTAAGKRSDYMRAQGACLDARGYSVR